MNDFTKEELECIYGVLPFACDERKRNQKVLDSVRIKLKHIIDNYCEHEWVADSTHMPFGTICVNCSKRGYDDSK